MIPIPFLLFFGEKILDWVCTLPPLTKFATAYKQKSAFQNRSGHEICAHRFVPFCGNPAAGYRRMVGGTYRHHFEDAENQGAAVNSGGCRHGGHHYVDCFPQRDRCGEFVLMLKNASEMILGRIFLFWIRCGRFPAVRVCNPTAFETNPQNKSAGFQNV